MRSIVWKHFAKTDSDYIAECNHCTKSLSYKTVANLKKHLVRVHPNVVASDSSNKSKGGSLKREEFEDSNFEDANNGKRGEVLEQQEEAEDVEKYFEKLPSNRAQCVLCKETLSRNASHMKRHVFEKHRNVALDEPSDTEEDQNYYTEVIYVEDEQQPVNGKQEPKTGRGGPRKRRRSSVRAIHEAVQIPDDYHEDVENFGRYVVGLLKKMPKELNTQLQMDIINLVMRAKLNQSTSGVREGGVAVATLNSSVISTSYESFDVSANQ